MCFETTAHNVPANAHHVSVCTFPPYVLELALTTHTLSSLGPPFGLRESFVFCACPPTCKHDTTRDEVLRE
jgi:hypothetical protein